MTPRLISFVALAALVATTACSTSRRAASGHSLSNAEMAAIVRARSESARTRFTDADVDFMSGMISHHAQAIVMARLAVPNGASPSVQVLAGRIINAQQDEIGLMQSWLRDRSLPVPEAKPAPMKMRMGGTVHEMLMPGMLSDEQMRELERARGAEFDRVFLTYMIQHHKGAVTMVTELFSKDGAGQDDVVFKFASDVNTDQTTEIARMERMLLQLRLEGKLP